ncbi:hypothetical protein RND81_10G200400 [Saponaria officinalis]|uniref:Uncharacterized protein n=1 Tax=Saponaria officinalis TaxID=3572 RepID=A0AAW1I463_SAPOF
MEEKTESANERVSFPVDEWERKAKNWLSSLPKGHKLSTTEVEAWVNSNSYCLPDAFKSLSQSDHFRRFAEMLSSLQSNTRGENPARFQRTELWQPVYTWLESLDLDDVISSQDISDWLAANPKIYDQLCAKHTRHHLMHYVKKCHIKMLKKKKGKHFKPNLSAHRAVERHDVPHLAISISANPLMNIPKDSDLYRVKREEAVRKYEILVDLEKKLSGMISMGNTIANSMET